MEILKTDAKQIEIVPIGDIHIGSRAHKGRHFRRTVDYVAAGKNRYWVYMGDGPDNAMPGSHGLDEQVMLPTEQIKALAGHFKKISSKLIAAVIGNHEQRSIRHALLDPTALLMQTLGGLDRYLGVGGLCRIVVGKQVYHLAIHHGCRYSKANKFTEFDDRKLIHPDADLLMLGHTHHLGSEEIITLSLDEQGKEYAKPIYYVRTGTYQGYADYARFGAMRPGRIGSPILRFHSNPRRIEIDCQTLAAV